MGGVTGDVMGGTAGEAREKTNTCTDVLFDGVAAVLPFHMAVACNPDTKTAPAHGGKRQIRRAAEPVSLSLALRVV